MGKSLGSLTGREAEKIVGDISFPRWKRREKERDVRYSTKAELNRTPLCIQVCSFYHEADDYREDGCTLSFTSACTSYAVLIESRGHEVYSTIENEQEARAERIFDRLENQYEQKEERRKRAEEQREMELERRRKRNIGKIISNLRGKQFERQTK